ncbi:MAG: hypothetical protein GQ534_03015 [Candidatus Delongbacteria bacterium]|nr:hypothetical protein [Candidatus Delongbacteria bacterium]
MDLQIIKEFLLWCSIINIGILSLWFIAFMSAADFIYKMHSKFNKITREQFNGIHYAGMMFFKTAVFVFFVIPYIVILIIE